MNVLTELHRQFDAESNAKVGLALLILLGVSAAIYVAFPGTGADDRLQFYCMVLTWTIFGLASSIYACTFPQTTWELIALPSPLYGVLVWALAAAFYGFKILETMKVVHLF